MFVNDEMKARIIEAMKNARDNFGGSDAKFATSLSINAAQYSRVMRGDMEKVLSDEKWINIARILGVGIGTQTDWKTANTPVFQFITTQLEKCQEESLSALLCDMSDIGKTYAALHYQRNHKNVVYVDCSQVKSKQKLIRKIAKSFGVGSTGRYDDVYEDLVFYLKQLPTPLVILDEAGDLHYEAFLEIKALWNATERACGYYMMGADGLRQKIRRAIDNKKVGYTEIFSRFGRKYIQCVPDNTEKRESFLQQTAAMIIKANCKEGTDVQKVLRSACDEYGVPSLRRINKELSKIQG